MVVPLQLCYKDKNNLIDFLNSYNNCGNVDKIVEIVESKDDNTIVALASLVPKDAVTALSKYMDKIKW